MLSNANYNTTPANAFAKLQNKTFRGHAVRLNLGNPREHRIPTLF